MLHSVRPQTTRALAACLTLGACTAAPAPTPEAQPVAVGSPWQEARLRGATFRAVGQEPGWTLELHADSLRYVGDYGETLLVVSAPEPECEGGTCVYDADGLRVTIRQSPCSDTMSGVRYSHEVTVALEGRELRGCGQPLADVIDGIEWRLVTLGDAPAVEGGPAPYLRLNVESPEVTGSTGCNRLRGPVERSGSELRFGALATTRMACTDPALARQESEFLRALERVDRFTREGDELIVHAGQTALARFRAAAADDQ